jgi:hypothetical protein
MNECGLKRRDWCRNRIEAVAMVLVERYRASYLFSSVSCSNARHTLTHILGDSQDESPEWRVHAARAKLNALPGCLNRHVPSWGETSDIVGMRRPFHGCSPASARASGAAPGTVCPVTIRSPKSDMHPTCGSRLHESFVSVML